MFIPGKPFQPSLLFAGKPTLETGKLERLSRTHNFRTPLCKLDHFIIVKKIPGTHEWSSLEKKIE